MAAALKKIAKTFDLVIEANTDTFSELAKLAGLAPETDFQNIDLSDIDFGPSDLTEYVLRGSTLDRSNLSQCIFGHQTLDGVSSLKGCILPQNPEPRDRRFTTISGRLNRKDRMLAEVGYGSMRQAGVIAISALMQIKDLSVIEQVGALIRSGHLSDDLEDRISHFTLPVSRIEYIRRLRSKSGYQATDVMRSVLVLANAAKFPSDYDTVVNLDSKLFSHFIELLPKVEAIKDDQLPLF